MDILLAKASGLATAEFEVRKDAQLGKGSLPVTLFLVGSVESGKAVTVEYNSEGTTWVQCKVDGVNITLDANTNIRTLYGPGTYRVSRAADAGTVGVLIA